MKKFIIAFILLIPSLLFSAPLQNGAYKIANKDSGYVVEKTNKNDGKRIDEYLNTVGIPKGNPYCAAAVYTWYNESAKELGIKNPLYKTAATNQIFLKALADPIKYKFIKKRNIELKSEHIQLGDIVLWKTSNGLLTDRWHGHTGFAVKEIDNKSFYTIEANTTGTNIISEQREQTTRDKHKGGVYWKKRTTNKISGFDLLGVVRVNNDK